MKIVGTIIAIIIMALIIFWGSKTIYDIIKMFKNKKNQPKQRKLTKKQKQELAESNKENEEQTTTEKK